MLYYGTEFVGDMPAYTFDERLGRCYSLAGYALAIGDVPFGTILVHGTIHGIFPGTTRIGYAWLELVDGTVWEPSSCDIYSNLVWDAIARPRDIRRYTVNEARCVIASCGHWGPWDTTTYSNAIAHDDSL